MRAAALAVAVVLGSSISSTALAQGARDCFVVHGRLRVGNGTPSARIWRIGTTRILGVPDGPAGDEAKSLPANIRKAMAGAPFVTSVFGDFHVCALAEDRLGQMRMVMLESATITAVDRRN